MASGVMPHGNLYGMGGMFMSQALFPEEIVYFNDNDDLNSAQYTIPGKYNVRSAVSGGTLLNKPAAAGNLFQMLVYNPHNSETVALGTTRYRYRMRILITWSGTIFVQQVHCENSTTILYEKWRQISAVAES